jgi:poly [ADP-ribose] polymerase
MARSTIKESDISVTIAKSHKRWTLNFTDLMKNSNKFYNLELIEDSSGSIYIYTVYGRLGGTEIKEFRKYNSILHAEDEANKIIKSKIKKGYVEIKLVQAAVGSDVAKSKVEITNLSEESAKKLGYKIEQPKSTLHPKVQDVVKNWFCSIEQFVTTTLDTSKCVLGQLSLDQINKGRELLLEARKLVATASPDINELNSISSKYYSNIPMNFGYKKLNLEQLRFDSNDKLDTAFDILDTLEGAKDVEKVLTLKNAIDSQYNSLKTPMEYIDSSDPIFKWIETLFHKTRASNHSYLGKMKVTNVLKLDRSKEYETYIKYIDSLKSKPGLTLPDNYKPIWKDRIKEDKVYEELIQNYNILPLWHGTRTPNFPKILSSRLMMRKPGFTVAGSMFDKNGALYFANSSSKSSGYTDISGGIWSGGKSKKAYLFLSDVCLGKSTIATRAYPYTLDYIKPNNSVWAKAGQSLYNDEFMVYTENQNWLRYVVEFESS